MALDLGGVPDFGGSLILEGSLTLERVMVLGLGRVLSLACEMTLGRWGILCQIEGGEMTLAREMALANKGVLLFLAVICHLGRFRIHSLGGVIYSRYLWKGNRVTRGC